MINQGLLSHTVSIVRQSNTVTSASGVTLNYSTSISYPNDVVLELTVDPADVVVFSVVGLLNGTTQTSTVSFTGNGVYIMETDEYYDTITSITSDVAPTTCTVSAKSKSGQYMSSDVTVYDSLKCRLDYVKGGSVSFLQAGFSVNDKRVLYTNEPEGEIQIDDIVTDNLSNRYRVVGIDAAYGRNTYHHSEILLELI